MLQYDFHESVGFWVLEAARFYQKSLNDAVAPHGLTFRQCQVLGFLALEGPLSQTALADRLRIEPPTLAGILDRMQRDGWIRRDECEQDRRRKLIHPTAAAEPIWNTMVTCGRRVRAQATRGLSEREIETLKALLGRILKNLEADLAEPSTSDSDAGTTALGQREIHQPSH